MHGWLLQGNLFGSAMKRLRPATVLITSERNLGHNLTSAKRPLERLVARTEDVATANSRAVRDAAVERVPSRRAHFRVIPPGVAAPKLRGEPKITTAVMVGRLHPVKDHETAVRAWRRVRAVHPEATLTIVGDGPEQSALERLVRHLGLETSVSLVGEGDPAPHLYGAGLYLSTSTAEGFSRALLEALAVGLPIVCTPAGGAAELPGEAVRLVPPGDEVSIGASLVELLADPSRRARMRRAAVDVAAQFAPHRCHASYAELYDEVTS